MGIIQSIAGAFSLDAMMNRDKKEEKLNVNHADDLRHRLQVVADRKHPSETTEIYGTIRLGYREPRKLTRRQRIKIQDRYMGVK